MWRDIRHPRTGRLLFRYDPERAIIQVQERGEKVTVDLQEYPALDVGLFKTAIREGIQIALDPQRHKGVDQA